MRYVILFLFAFLIAGCTSGSPEISTEPKPDDKDAIVIDVRSQKEWDGGHVEKAVHIPHTEIVERISEVTNDKDAKIVVYCAVGGRAGKAKTALEGIGFTNVENGGGYDDVKDRFKEPTKEGQTGAPAE